MSSSNEFVGWTTVRLVDWPAVLWEGRVLPRYAQFGGLKDYVGMRETPEAAWTTRGLSKESDASPTDFYLVKSILTPLGFMRFSTDMYRPGLPRFHKAIYSDGKGWGAWRFYGAVPLSANDPATGAPLLRLEIIKDWDISKTPESEAAIA